MHVTSVWISGLRPGMRTDRASKLRRVPPHRFWFTLAYPNPRGLDAAVNAGPNQHPQILGRHGSKPRQARVECLQLLD